MSHRSSFMRRAALLAATAAVSLLFGRAFADDAVLIASTVPGYVPGMVVSATDRLSVPEGASATLLFQSGEIMRLGGPFEGTLGQEQAKAGSNSIAMLADLFRLHGVDATMIGGTRATSLARSGALHRRCPGRCATLRHLLYRAFDVGLDRSPDRRPAHLCASSQGQEQDVGLAGGSGARGMAGRRSDRGRQPVRNRH